MQFKIVRYRDQNGVYHEGSTIQCLRRKKVFSDAHPDGKNVQKVVAKIDRWARELPSHVASVLTDEEKSEWQEWRVKHDETRLRTVTRFELDALPDRLQKTAQALQFGAGAPTVEEADAIWAGLEAMAKALKAAGFERPKKSKRHVVYIENEQFEPLPNFRPPGTDSHRAYQRMLDDYAARQKVVVTDPLKKT